MDGLFRVVVFDVRKRPDVRWILAFRVARQLTRVRPLEMFFVRVFRGDANRVEIKRVVV